MASSNHIVIRRNIKALSLLVAWFMVFAMPAFLIYISLDYLCKMTRSVNQRMISSSMISDMESFRRELDIGSYLQRRLERYFIESPIARYPDPARLAADIASATGLQPAMLIMHGADTIETAAWFSDFFKSGIRGFSNNLMRRYLVSINNQLQHEFHNQANQNVIQGLFRFVDPVKSKRDSDLFLRRLLGLISEVPVLPERVSKSLSSNLGGSLYFYYRPFYENRSGQSDKLPIRSGFFLVFAGRDIPWIAAAKDAITVSTSVIQRKLIFSDISLWDRNVNSDEVITRFNEDEEGCHLVSTLSQTAIVDLIQGGTFLPRHLEKVLRKVPLLEVSVPWSALQHPIVPWLPQILFIFRLYVMLGALFLLRFYFFGVDFKAGIATKVVTGTAFILLLPVTLLLAGFTTWNQFNRVYAWYMAENSQRRMFSELGEKFTAYQQAIQQKSFDIADAVAKLVESGKCNQIQPLLQSLIKDMIASDISVDLPDAKVIRVESSTYKSYEDPRENSNRRLTSIAVFSSFNDSGKFTRTTFNGEDRDITAIDSRFINDVVNRCGKFYKLSRLHERTRFSSIYIHKPGRNDPMALLTIRYDDEHLLRTFVRRYLAESPEYAEISASYLLVRDDAGIKRYYSLFTDEEVRNSELIQRFNLANVSGQHLRRVNNRDLEQIFAMSDYPLLIQARSANVTGRHGTSAFIGILIVYSFMLLIFVFLVFMLIYLRPIREFIGVTEKVAAGDYQCRVNLDQADEFGDLKQTFDTMIQGLEQRRRLTQFVSSEVIKAVESDSEESMTVGGERVEATVAFVQLEKLQHLKSEASPEEIFATLGDFIAAADIAASQHGGVVDKLVEDTLMLVFRCNPARPDHALAASAAVLDLEHQMRARDLRICAGIASGQVVSGRIGSRLGKLDFTVIGDPVNLAARLKAQAKKASNTGIIIAPGAIRILRGRARVTFIERTELKGKSREYPLYELVALRSAEK